MILRAALGLVLLALAVPAKAERLTFDHRLQPRLKAVLDSGDSSRVDYNGANPRYVVDRITVAGTSSRDWTEQLEIIARTPAKDMRSAADWIAELTRAADARCTGQVTELARDEISITIERRTTGACAGEPVRQRLFRVVAGKRSLFLLGVYEKGPLSEADRAAWLAMLASAHLD